MISKPLRVAALVLSLALLAASCTDVSDQPLALATIPEVATATPVPTTSPLSLPTATPTPTPIATTIPTPTAVPPTPVPPTPVPPTPVPPTPVPPTPVPPTPVPATPVPTEVPPTPVPEPTPIPPTEVPEPAEPTVEPGGEGGPPADHAVTTVGYVTLGVAGETTLRIPAALVELIGFHEASHPGSQEINAAGTGLEMMLLASRGRGTPARSAADIVVPPGEPLRAPVTGTVVSATTYILYCKHEDSLVYIEPDGLPGWQVRLFHVRGELPAVGTRVIAGETVVASEGANPLPFQSQIDEFTAEPSWPHVHLEVVDTSVPDDRPPGGGC